MTRAFQIAWALVRVPNLSRHLFVLPILVSVSIVLGQLVTTGFFLQAASRSSVWQQGESAATPPDDSSPVRLLLYGSGERRGPLQVCRWIARQDNPNQEVPPSIECQADSLDVAINVSNPQDFIVDEYVPMFEGQVDRLHICKRCAPEAVISVTEDGEAHTRANSMWGIALLSLAFLPREALRAERLDTIELTRNRVGSISLFMPESARLINISVTNPTIAFTLNIVPLIIIALWLAVRAHGKVLHYFAQNHVLLPLVAATGKRTFYCALWILTGARVGCFLAASIPLVYFGLEGVAGRDVWREISAQSLDLIVWFGAVVPAVGLSTMVASVADLKHRYAAMSFVYRYAPLLIAFLGSVIWLATFISPSDVAGAVRSLVTAIPVLGLAPVFIAPVTAPPSHVLLAHGGLSLAIFLIVARFNVKWFAAHLEDV